MGVNPYHRFSIGDIVIYSKGRTFATRVVTPRQDWTHNQFLMSGVPLRDTDAYAESTSCGRPEDVRLSCPLEVALLALSQDFTNL